MAPRQTKKSQTPAPAQTVEDMDLERELEALEAQTPLVEAPAPAKKARAPANSKAGVVAKKNASSSPAVATPAVASPTPATKAPAKARASKASAPSPAPSASTATTTSAPAKAPRAKAQPKAKASAPAPTTPVVTVDSADALEDTKGGKRTFKLVPNTVSPPVSEEQFGGSSAGRYVGNTPMQAAKKAFTQLARKAAKGGACEYTYTIQESTHNSDKKQRCYHGTRVKLETPQQVTRAGVVYNIEHSNVVRSVKVEA